MKKFYIFLLLCSALSASELKWISVKDELPPEDEYIIVFNEYGSVYVTSVLFSEDENMSLKVLDYIFNDGAIVTHWMPLPETPKDQNEMDSN